MAAGLIAFGVGALVGSLLPASGAEQQAATKVKDAATPVLSDAAKQVSGNLKEPAQQAVEAVKGTATDAAATVKDEGDVRGAGRQGPGPGRERNRPTAVVSADDASTRPGRARLEPAAVMTHAYQGAKHMTNPDELQNIMGRTAVDTAGDKIGKIGQIYLDDASGSPQWVTISTGLFGTKESFAPISGYRLDGDNVVLNVTKDQVKDAPNVDADGHLDDAENDRLYEYYSGSFSSGGRRQRCRWRHRHWLRIWYPGP